jgi:hypothetical protein
MLIYSMSVSMDGFIADARARWVDAPSEEQFRFHIGQVRELGGYQCGRSFTRRWSTTVNESTSPQDQ